MQKNNAFDDFGDLLLGIYRLSHEMPLQEFQDASLDAVRRVLPFDSSMWGSATYVPGGIDIHTLHLHRQPPEMLAGYEEIKHLDTAAAAVALQPHCTLAFDARVWFGGTHQKAIRAYGDKFHQRHFFISSMMNPASAMVQWVTLFRAAERAYCTESERRLLASIAPHLQEAVKYNRVRHLTDLYGGGGNGTATGGQRAQAVADARGWVFHATPHFDALLRQEWGLPPAGCLPEPLMQEFRAGQMRFVGRALVAHCRVERGLLFVKMRPCCAADRLSAREWQVARLVAKGLSHKQVARLLERSPATVRNHIQAIYRRLGVGSIAELIAVLQMAAD